eukprot:Partr_v1_DN28065_c1_g1_i1_m56739 putative Zinc finger, DHHC-type containing 6
MLLQRLMWSSRRRYFHFQIGVTLLIAFLHIGSLLAVIMPWFEWIVFGGSWKQSVWLLTFNFGVIMIYWTYWLACTTPPITISPRHVQQNETALIERLRFCHKCNLPKPPRARHCRKCGKCILRFCHDCPWINNCVGFHNHSNFLRFLIYVSGTCSMLFWTLLYRGANILAIMDRQWRRRGSAGIERWTKVEGTCLIIILIVDAIVVISVGILTLYHIYYAATNVTTLESFENDRIFSQARRAKNPVVYPYNLGVCQNIKEVLGDRFYLWLWPLQPPRGDGFTYRVRDDLLGEAREWPPLWFDRDSRNPLDSDSTTSDEEYYRDTDEEQDDNERPTNKGRQSAHQHHRLHVRRGSEGYEVRSISLEDRQRMLNSESEFDTARYKTDAEPKPDP